MERSEHPDMTATLDGQELPDLDELTLQWVLSELDAYQVDDEMLAEVAEALEDREAAVKHKLASDAIAEASARLCRRALDRKDAR